MTIARPVAALAAITALVTSCSDTADHAAGASKDDRPQETGIVATAAGGMKVEFKDFTVTCRPSEDDQPDAQIVSATSGWDFHRGPGGPTVPTEPAMLIEAADTTGQIEVISASCDPEPRLEVRIDGTFGSEVSDATVTVKGYVSAD